VVRIVDRRPALHGLPLGGGAMLAIYNELRCPIIGMFDGVTFADIVSLGQAF
jgi:hypothetical protein